MADGSHDWMDESSGRVAASSMPAGAKVHQVPLAGHHLYMENPSWYNRVIIDEITRTR